MNFTEFHDLAVDAYDRGGDIVSEYDEFDYNEWVDTLNHEPSLKDFLELCKFWYECEERTGVRPNGRI